MNFLGFSFLNYKLWIIFLPCTWYLKEWYNVLIAYHSACNIIAVKYHVPITVIFVIIPIIHNSLDRIYYQDILYYNVGPPSKQIAFSHAVEWLLYFPRKKRLTTVLNSHSKPYSSDT